MPLSRTDYKEALASTVAAGEAVAAMIALGGWQRIPSELVRARRVLKMLEWVGLEAQDVLDQMEETDNAY